MHPYYGTESQGIKATSVRNHHYAPHLHTFMECIFLQKGSLMVGQGTEFYSMEPGDFAVIFPNTIHYYQVFGTEESRSVFLMAPIEDAGVFEEYLRTKVAENPIIKAADLDPEVRYALQKMMELKQEPYKNELNQAYFQIILAKCCQKLKLVDKKTWGTTDLIYDAVVYISAHYKEDVSLTSMAQDLGVSPYVLSRVFSSTFHTNFNAYLNDVRLKSACNMLKYSKLPITEIALETGFTSLRTFNRVCRDKLRMTPREYRRAYQETEGQNAE